MATVIAGNIISPLGYTAEDNYQAIKSGKSALCHYQPSAQIPFGFTASLFSQQQNKDLCLPGYTRFESLAIRSIKAALDSTDIQLSDRTVLIISSTKGNVELLSLDGNADNVVSIGVAAKRIAHCIGLSTNPIVACNACISGVSAMIIGNKLVDCGVFDNAIVCGADLQNRFIISGFQSLKALSEAECRPFDIERLGLNLGEAAATIILSNKPGLGKGAWHIRRGAVRNDAFHITNPSPIGDGCTKAINYTLDGFDKDALAQVNAHGTATMYNDQMESKAISNTGLSNIPANALKGYLGHTMGAAGIIETILTMTALDDHSVIGTRGYDEIGVSGRVNISPSSCQTHKTDFLKIISGFGGCNAAVLLSKEANRVQTNSDRQLIVSHRVRISPNSASIDGNEIQVQEHGIKLLTWLYKSKVNDYPKFYKMDPLARLGFVATELLLQADQAPRFQDSSDRAIIFFNKSASANADREYLKTISDPDNFFPSPSLFVYTLPNIVTGEIAIRNKCHSETSFYVLPDKDQDMMDRIIKSTFSDSSIGSVIAGWLEYKDENDFECDIYLANIN